MFVELAPPVTVTVPTSATSPRSWSRVLAGAVPYLYLLPALVGLAIWIYRPITRTVELSFFDWNLLPTTPKVGVGLDNYGEVLERPEARTAILNTDFYIVGLLPFSVLLPTAIALATRNIGGRARSWYRGALFVPVLVTPVVTAAIWRWLLHPTGGPVDRLVETVGLGPVNWFRDGTPALLAIIGIAGWKLLGFSVLVISAGLAGINGDYAAAAEVDGASRWQITRHITLPLLSPSLMFMVLLTVLLSAQWVFPLVDILTQGGPGDATTNLYYLLWTYGFRNFDVGFSSAAAVLFFLGFGALALVFVRLLDRFSFYDS